MDGPLVPGVWTDEDQAALDAHLRDRDARQRAAREAWTLKSILSGEGGQERRRQLDEFFAPVENAQGFDRVTEIGDMVNPVSDVGRAGVSAQGVFDPNATGWERAGSLGAMLTDMAAVAAPAFAGKLSGQTANAVIEALTGVTGPVDDIASDAVRRFAADESGRLGHNGGPSLPFTRGVPVPEQPAYEPYAAAGKDPRWWHGASGQKLRRPLDEYQFRVEMDNTLLPDKELNPEALLGEYLTPFPGDRTWKDGRLLGINDVEFDTPVEMFGGFEFMRRPDGMFWASEPGAVNTKNLKMTQHVDKTGKTPVGVFMAMGDNSGDFNTMTAETMRQLLAKSEPTPEAIQFANQRIREMADTGRKIEVPGRKSKAPVLGFPDFPGFESEHFDEWFSGLKGSARRGFWQALDNKVLKDGGFPDLTEARLATTHPDLLDARQGQMGMSFGRPDLEAGVVDTSAIHPSYGQGWLGEHLGGFGKNIDPELLFPEFFARRRRMGGAAAQRGNIITALRTTPQIFEKFTEEKLGPLVRALRGFGRDEAGSLDTGEFLGNLRRLLTDDGAIPSPEERGQTLLDLIKTDPASVTDDMFDMGDEVLNTRLNQYLYDNYDLPMDAQSRMARADEHFPLDQYHSTYANFDTFEKGDIGFHMGTEEQANQRLKDRARLDRDKAASIIPLRADIRNPVRLPDVGLWNDSEKTAAVMRNKGVADRDALRQIIDEASDLKDKTDMGDWLSGEDPDNLQLLHDLKRLLQEEDYDGVIYHNEVENLYGHEPGLTRQAQARAEALQERAGDIRRNAAARAKAPEVGATEDEVVAWLNNPNRGKLTPEEQAEIDAIDQEFLDLYEFGKNSPDSHIALEPEQIRSRFARFDPRLKHLANLLAGIGGVGMVSTNQGED